MKIAMFEGYRKHPRRKRYGAHRKHKRRHYKGASPKQMAVRRRFKAAIVACKMVKGKAKWACVRKKMKAK